jgi:hypothetical protein
VKNVKIRIVILPVFLYGCETCTLKIREEHRIKVFVNGVLKGIFERKRDEKTRGWIKLHNEVFLALYSLLSIIRMIKSRRMICAELVTRMG